MDLCRNIYVLNKKYTIFFGQKVRFYKNHMNYCLRWTVGPESDYSCTLSEGSLMPPRLQQQMSQSGGSSFRQHETPEKVKIFTFVN